MRHRVPRESDLLRLKLTAYCSRAGAAGRSSSANPTRCSISERTRSMPARAISAPSCVGSMCARNGRLPVRWGSASPTAARHPYQQSASLLTHVWENCAVHSLRAKNINVVELGKLHGCECLGGTKNHVPRIVNNHIDAALLPHDVRYRVRGKAAKLLEAPVTTMIFSTAVLLGFNKSEGEAPRRVARVIGARVTLPLTRRTCPLTQPASAPATRLR
jgi:hypothetical protein